MDKFDDLITNGNSNNNRGINRKDYEYASSTTAEDIKHETYTEEEIQDVNAIQVTIPDPDIPIVIFFGSPASGKTLALLRMIRYLEQHNHRVEAEPLFRPKTDRHYTRMCAELKDMAYNQYTPGGNDVISFMLVKVLNDVGKPVCQILEAPGEHYFDGGVDSEFPRYIKDICENSNRKVWVFFVEQGWGINQNERDRYAQRICDMQNLISTQDRIVFLFNKCDKHRRSQYLRDGKPNKKVYFTNIQNQYKGIFDNYTNSDIVTRFLYGKYNFKTICFSAGTFSRTNDGKEAWTVGKDFYCKELWDAIH